jgi:hypothetical protein
VSVSNTYIFFNADDLSQITVADNLKPLYDKLHSIRNKLEKLSLTQAWSLREIDLFVYIRQLDRIDDSRVDGNFLNSDGEAEDGQHVGSFDSSHVASILTIPGASVSPETFLCLYLQSSACI